MADIDVTCPRCGHDHSIRAVVENPGDDKFLKVTDVARMMGVGRQTVQRWINEKKIHAVRASGRTNPWLISMSSLADFRRTHSSNKPR